MSQKDKNSNPNKKQSTAEINDRETITDIERKEAIFLCVIFFLIRRYCEIYKDAPDLVDRLGELSCPDIDYLRKRTQDRFPDRPCAHIDRDIQKAADSWAKALHEQYSANKYNAKMGRLGELAAGTYFDAEIKREIYPPEKGDDGWDFTALGYRWDVKTTTHDINKNLNWRINFNTMGKSDCYCFATWSSQHSIVYIHGFATVFDLILYGDIDTSHQSIIIHRRHLRSLEYCEISPEEIRQVQPNELKYVE